MESLESPLVLATRVHFSCLVFSFALLIRFAFLVSRCRSCSAALCCRKFIGLSSLTLFGFHLQFISLPGNGVMGHGRFIIHTAIQIPFDSLPASWYECVLLLHNHVS